jgi:hypothetical protein
MVVNKPDELTERVFVRLSKEDRDTLAMLGLSRKGRARSLSSLCREYIRNGITKEIRMLKNKSEAEAESISTPEKIKENKDRVSIISRIKNILIEKDK